MALQHSPSIVTNGLVMSYDMSNTAKSWKGAPTTNLLTNPNSAINVNSTDVPVGISVPGYSSYSSGYAVAFWSPVSTAATGVTFSYSMYMRSPGGVSTYLMYVYTGTGSDGGWNYAGSGSLTDTWTRYTYTSGSWTGTVTNVCVYRYNQIGTIEIAAPQFEVNSFTTPFVIGSRSNTQAIMDQTGNNTFTASNLTYASDNTFSFNGSTNYMSCSNTGITHGASDWTYTAWLNWTAITSLGTVYENGIWGNSLLLRFETSGFTVYSMGSLWGFLSFTPALGTWYNVAFVRSGSNVYLYVNGTLTSSIAGFTATVVPNTSLIYIGMSQHAAGQCFNGKIAAGSIYTRALSTNEISQNFAALRGRYGV
jgi:hypothetical protein